jgi:hypothetical protein
LQNQPPIAPFLCPFNQKIQELADQFPTQLNRESLLRIQREYGEEQGKFIPPAGRLECSPHSASSQQTLAIMELLIEPSEKGALRSTGNAC